MSDEKIIENSFTAMKDSAKDNDLGNAFVHLSNILLSYKVDLQNLRIDLKDNITIHNFEEIHSNSHHNFRKKGVAYYLKGCAIITATVVVSKFLFQYVFKFVQFVGLVK